MSPISVTVAVPTLAADEKLVECIRALKRQTLPGAEVIVVDNSGRGLARRRLEQSGDADGVRILENSRNLGFGGAVNQAFRSSEAPLLATINDDAVAQPQWLAALANAMNQDPATGMCASRVRLLPSGVLDSAGMRIAADGSSKQRGHGDDPETYRAPGDCLLPSGSAALYRRELIQQTGGFDEDFFLYCEDTDLGLRALWAGWKCRYVADAIADHHYSHSAGAASSTKAYFVERNRLFTVIKNFPLGMLPAVPFAAIGRYFWHIVWMIRSRGAAARYRQSGGAAPSLAWLVIKAHLAAFFNLPALIAKRQAIRRKISSREFARLLRAHRITVREVAAL